MQADIRRPARPVPPRLRGLRRGGLAPAAHSQLVCRCPDCSTAAAEPPLDAEPVETLELDEHDGSAFEWEGEVSRSSVDYVRWVQSSLNRLDGARLVVDGISGTLTRAAVRGFQSRRGLDADGIVGPITEAALIAAGAGAPPGYAGTVPAPPPQRPAPAPSPGTLPHLTVPESALTALLPTFAPYAYAAAARYPWPVPGVSGLDMAPPQNTNCCCFAEALITRAFSQRHGSAFVWNSTRHGQAMINDAANLFSPIDAYVGAGAAGALPVGAAPDSWCLVQGWTTAHKGHTFIVVARHAPTDRVLTLEANMAYGLNGVGCRSVSMLRDLPGGRPPTRWWQSSSVPTWSSIARYYDAGVRIARLGVTSASWAGPMS